MKRQQTKTNIRKRLRRGTLNTCAKIQGLTLTNGVDIWTFVRVSAKITSWHCNYLVLVCIRFWALFWLHIGPTLSVLRFFERNFCTDIPWSTWKRLVLKKMGHFFLPTVNACLLLTSSKVRDWSGHSFGASASPRSFTKKMAMQPSSTVHGSQHDTCLLYTSDAADE